MITEEIKKSIEEYLKNNYVAIDFDEPDYKYNIGETKDAGVTFSQKEK
jgi:hypothetical protein